MMNLWEVLKASKTGIAPDFYTRLLSEKLASVGKIAELADVPPLYFKSDGKSLIDYTIYGNTVQNGKPTPDNPIIPHGTGERTGNLLDKTAFTAIGSTIEQIKDGIRITTQSNGYAARIILDVLQNTDYRISYIWKNISGGGSSVNTVRVFAGTDSSTQIAVFAYSNGGTFNTGNNKKINIWFYAAFSAAATVEYTNIMLNLGSTALPYEPYGQYKIPISSASTTTPIYLGEVESTRRIKKLVLKGNENGFLYPFQNTNGIGLTDVLDVNHLRDKGFCSHYPVSTASALNSLWIGVNNKTLYFVGILDVLGISTFSDFRSYLAAQYAAGTPVTVWYILAEPTTGVVNEPLMKIGDYADTLSAEQAGVEIPTIRGDNVLDVNTAVKPTKVRIKYHAP